MKTKLKVDWSYDIISREKIDYKQLKEVYRNRFKTLDNVYKSQMFEIYYREKYNKNLLEVLNLEYEIPLCPITNEFVSFTHGGQLGLGKYSSSCTQKQITKHISENNENFKSKIKTWKTTRKGKNNPAYGTPIWNKGLTRETDDRLRKMGDKRKGIVFTQEHRNKLRENAIKQLKNGGFPQTNTLPCRIFKSLLDFYQIDFVEEYRVGYFTFDFLIPSKDILVEIQGDYWHCNPETEYAMPVTKAQIQNFYRDIKKNNSISSQSKYSLIYIWENDLLKNLDKVKTICTQKLKM